MGNIKMVRGRMMRATRLNGCGNPVLGPRSVVVTKGYVSAALTSNLTTPEAINVTIADGSECITDEPAPRFKNYTAEITFCGVDPELITLLTGQPVVFNAAGDEIVGFRQNSRVNVDLIGFALELWTAIPGAVCSENGEPEYGYILLPFFGGGQLGDFTVENAAVTFTLTGATTKDGSGWGVGPFDVTLDGTGQPGPLNEPIDADGDHMHLERVGVAPPQDSDGAIPLGVPATGANVTSTNPATLAPTNSYPPADLADAATGFTATPTTAWETGKYVVLGDGSEAHWDGTAWVAGRA